MAVPNAIVIDSSVLIHDPDAVDVLREGGNTLIVPWSVIFELERLRNKPDIGMDAMMAIDKLEAVRAGNNGNLKMVKNPDFSGLEFLDRGNTMHQVIAVARAVANDGAKHIYNKVKLVSRSSTLRLLAKDLGLRLEVEDYLHNQVSPLSPTAIKEVRVSANDIVSSERFAYEEDKHGDIIYNAGVVCHSNHDPLTGSIGEWRNRFVALRKGRYFRIVSPDINIMDLKPISINGAEPNWLQHVAMGQLMDPDIQMVFLEGVAGTGKTLLALAAALAQRNNYKSIVVTRPMIHLEDVDRMGYLPGNEQEKMSPWRRPIDQALDFLAELNDQNKLIISNLRTSGKLVMEPLDYIRGMTYSNTLVIVDEAQNITPHMVKTIITRAGMRTKLIFTGDLDQIDRSRVVGRRSSGLAYGMKKTMGHRIVGVTTFHQTVRSPLASLAQEVL